MSRFFLWHPPLKPIWVPQNPTWISFHDKIPKYPTNRCNGEAHHIPLQAGSQPATCASRRCHAACLLRTRGVTVNKRLSQRNRSWWAVITALRNGAQNCPGVM